MTFTSAAARPKTRLAALCATFFALMLGVQVASQAETTEDNPDWAESVVPPPPAFDVGKLVTFEGAISSSLVYGVDPATLSFSASDGLLRYVLVATSASGARNVMYEAIRCATGEFKTYARYSSDGKWNMIADAQWRSVFASLPSKHALYFAKAGACDGAAPATSASVVVRRLKNPNFRTTD